MKDAVGAESSHFTKDYKFVHPAVLAGANG
jgi:hypothetical protein